MKRWYVYATSHYNVYFFVLPCMPDDATIIGSCTSALRRNSHRYTTSRKNEAYSQNETSHRTTNEYRWHLDLWISAGTFNENYLRCTDERINYLSATQLLKNKYEQSD